MKIDWKNTFKIAGILTAIASGGALLISLTNVLTGPIIETNRIEREKKGLSKVYGEDATFGEKKELKDDKYGYLLAYYPVIKGEENCRIYSTSGTNAYGTVSLLIGINSDFSLYNLAVMENTESYASVLNENYLTPLIKASDKEEAFEAASVKCGATYGAKLVRDMVNQAKDHFKEGKQ